MIAQTGQNKYPSLSSLYLSYTEAGESSSDEMENEICH